MSRSSYGGGADVKASTLSVGDTIRDPRKKDRIMLVESVGATIFVRGLDKSDKKYHRWIDCNATVIKVTNATTETSDEVIG